jgi:cell division protein FtsW (lipid II flippase)
MPLTRSTAAQRAAAAKAGRAASRTPELAALLAATLVTLIAVALAAQAKLASVNDLGDGLAAGRVVNLRAVDRAGVLLPALESAVPDSSERRFVAERIAAWLATGDEGRRPPLASVGSLAAIRVGEDQVPRARRLPLLRERLEAARAARGPAKEGEPIAPLAVPLLSGTQVAALRPALVVRAPGDFRLSVAWAAILFLVPFYGLHAWLRVRRSQADCLLLPAVLLLAGLGLALMVGLRDPVRDAPLFGRFAQGVAAGLLVAALVATYDFQRSAVRRLSYIPLLGAILLSTLLILFGSGPGTSDAKVNLLGVQPVEAIRLLIIFFLAGYFAQRWEFLRELREPGLAPRRLGFEVPRLDYVLPVLVGIALILAFFFLQKDLGPALVVACLFLSLYGIARGRIIMVVAGLLLLAGGFAAGYALGFPPTVVGRVQMWASPWNNAVRGGDQLAHAFWALSTGGLTGTGLGLGDPALVPAAHTDLIIAALGEELGLAGVAVALALLAFIGWRSLRIAAHAAGDYTFFLALGLGLGIVLPFLLIAGGLLGVLPLTGVATPFLSYGRSSMVANLAAIGILLAISARRPAAPATIEFARPTRVLVTVLGGVLCLIALRAGYLQAWRADATVASPVITVQRDGARRFAYNPRLLAVAEAIPRGAILDRNGIPLATSRPQDLEKHAETLARLGLRTPSSCAGETSRCYPFGGVTYHLLGDARSQVNWAASNTSFVERDSDARLRGYDDHARVVEVQAPGSNRDDRVVRRDLRELVPLLRYRQRPNHPAVKAFLARPRDVRLSIDIRLQLRAAAHLRTSISQGGRRRGAAVVLGYSGEVLAAVSYPWPEIPAAAAAAARTAPLAPGDEALLDRARYGLYPPGSSFKLVTATAALRKDPALARRTFTCVPLPGGRVGQRIPGWGRPIRDDPQDHTAHGAVDLERGLVVSCNAYFAQLGLALGGAALQDAAGLFEIPLGQPESARQVRDTLPFAAYGQGHVLASPLKMARVAGTIAGGGRMAETHWMAGEAAPDEPRRDVLAPAHAALLARAMRGVVTGGTGRTLGGIVPPIAGKTGTAEVQDAPSHAWFVGFAPYGGTGSRISFAVIVENGGYGARAAAPVAAGLVTAARDLGIIGAGK